MAKKILKTISLTYDALKTSEKKKIFKTLGYKNQTQYLKASGKSKNELNDAIVIYNEMIEAINQVIEKEKHDNKKEKNKKSAFNTFKKTLDRSIDQGLNFKKRFKDNERFKYMLDKISSSGRKYIITWDNHYYALSKKKIEGLMKRYRENDSFFVQKVAGGTEFSDEELMYRVASRVVSFVEVSNNKIAFKTSQPSARDHGEFFDMHHTTPFNLERYQIYTETCAGKLNKSDACFIHCLVQSGVDCVDLQMLRSSMRTRDLPKYLIKNMCMSIGIEVKIKTPRFNADDKKKNITKYGNVSEKYPVPIMIGLINNHYFLIEPMHCTMYALKHCLEPSFTSIESWQEMIFKGGRYRKQNDRMIDSFTFIQYMWDNKTMYLKNITLDEQIYMTSHYSKFTEITTLEYDDSLVRLTVPLLECSDDSDSNEINPVVELSPFQTQMTKPYCKEFFDFETTTDGKYHKPYLCRIADDEKVFINDCPDKKEYDKWIGYQLLKYLTVKNGYNNLRLYAHNAGYDIKFLFDFIEWDKIINRGHSLLRAYGKFYYAKGKFILVEIQDTKAFLACELRSFEKMFKLTVAKEIIPYRMYRERTMKDSKIWDQGMTRKRVMKFCKNEKVDYSAFMENCKKWGCIKESGMIDIIKYSSTYCSFDCQVLKQGWEKFRGWIEEITGLDVDDYISISSVVDSYFKKEGVYSDVYQVSSYIREFQQRCMVGGRTAMKRNEKQHLKNCRVSDFDATSLYPSAQSRLQGYLKGKPKVLNTTDFDTIQRYDGYFIEIKIIEVKKHRDFPLMSRITDAGVREWTNCMAGETFYCDKIMLEDLIEHHGLVFEIIRGYYYDEGRNCCLKEKIEHLFNKRLEAKKEGNPIEVVYKLMMNASYGKTLMKPFEDDSKIMTFEKAQRYIVTNYAVIKTIDILSDKKWEQLEPQDKVKITIVVPINTHFNNAPCGVEVLSMSKRIMNEVMCLAEDNGIDIYYQDTDSMHIDTDSIKCLSEHFLKKYSRELIGKGMGQFHSDFDSEFLDLKKVYSCETIILGKKCYIDKLTDGITMDSNGNLRYDYHIRMKGMNRTGIDHRATEDYGGDIMGVYRDLHRGIAIDFDLCGGGKKITFDHQKNGSISSKTEFIRKLKF
jgi:hypothetical protein